MIYANISLNKCCLCEKYTLFLLKINSMTSQEFKNIRLNLGLTQKELAERMGITMRTVQHYEHGDTPIKTVCSHYMNYLKNKK